MMECFERWALTRYNTKMGKRVENIKKHIVAIILITALLSTGCVQSSVDYHGDYPELYSIAINSIPGSTGYVLGEKKLDSEITIKEEDQYGRILFLYYEQNGISTYSMVICQKFDGEHSYFYPDYNFISAPDDSFSMEEIDALKEINDWGIEASIDKCNVVEIVRKKGNGAVPDKILMQLYNNALGKDARRIENIYYFISDDYGRSMYLGYGTGGRYVVMLFNPDGTYDENKCLMELTDLFGYQDELKAFKERNGWNMPLNTNLELPMR